MFDPLTAFKKESVRNPFAIKKSSKLINPLIYS